MADANMGPGYVDLYTTLADSKEMQIDGLDNAKEKRKIIKTVAVSWGYGAGWQTAADDLDSFRRENPEKAKYLWTQDIQEVNRLAIKIHTLLRKRFKTVEDYRTKVRERVAEVEEAGIKDQVDFVTPFLFQTVVRKCKFDELQKEVFSGQDSTLTELGKHTVQLLVHKPGEVLWKPEKGREGRRGRNGRRGRDQEEMEKASTEDYSECNASRANSQYGCRSDSRSSGLR
jgi:hypothetical protein